MAERSLGIRELKARLNECVKDVKLGATIIVTEHGRRVARLVPEGASVEERLRTLKDSGSVLWSGRPLRPARAGVRPTSRARTIAEILVEDRG